MDNRVDYEVLQKTVNTLGWATLPEEIKEQQMEDEEVTKVLHDVLLGKEIIEGMG